MKHYPTLILAVEAFAAAPPDGANAGSRGTSSSRQAQSGDPLQGAAQSTGLCFPSSELAKDTTDLSVNPRDYGTAPPFLHPHPLISIPTSPHPHPYSASGQHPAAVTTRGTSRRTETAGPSLHQHISTPTPHPATPVSSVKILPHLAQSPRCSAGRGTFSAFN